MSSNTQESLNLQQLLGKDHYKVPVYQRNYDWGEPQIQQLIDDIQDFAEKEGKTTYYYIGSLVVHEKTDYFEILDGQQRFTTLSLLACYLKYRIPESFEWYEEANLGFESRSKSEFTVDKLFDVFCSDETSNYDSPRKLSELISTIDTKKANASILEGFKAIDRVISRNFDDKGAESLNEFAIYLLSKVKILPVFVPKNTDVTHYFEVMNNRGEQLETHEVVKANLLSVVQGNAHAMATVQTVWLACSDMSRYVQLGFSVDERKAIFSEDSTGFLVERFEDLTNRIAVQSDGLGSKNGSLSLNSALEAGKELREKEGDKNISNDDNSDEGKAERFTSVIDFPNFLMQVLRIYLKPEPGKELPALDDKDLINAFKNFIGKDVKRVEDFVFSLLKLRYLFDHYIVKRERASGKEDWSLKRYKFDKNGSSYINSFGKEEGDKFGGNWSCAMLLSAFHVSYPTNSRKNWLSAVLYWLSQNEHSTPITAENYLDFLESLGRAFMVNRYLTVAPKEYTDFMYIIEQDESLNVAVEDLSEFLRYGRVRVFTFNYLDYLLWKGFDFSQETKSKFRFSFKSSVEHFSPQTSKINDVINSDDLHKFGNLCLMGSSDNSSLSNDSPREKVRTLEGRRTIMTPLSLKLELMIKALPKNREWIDTDINSHEEEMFKVLKEDIERAT
ncbi:DUF262 domain-containing protein [Psychrobacter sp. 72-O-c]|uniref:DUF262 domain-containing protein n=1 Tax=Psychrobacter sp. 72-O-c TaxID=2774125 RepID=UPI001917ACC2|nr:DUF262 domain-containing protein [Psychrobacter sp. 72-O-c]